MDTFPNKIHFLIDDTFAVFSQQLKSSDKVKLSGPTAEYKWDYKTDNPLADAINKSGTKFTITLSHLSSLLDYKLIEIC